MTAKTDGLVCLVVDVPGETREQFEAVMAHLATSGPVPPAEARLLVSGERAGRLADGERVGERGGDRSLLRGAARAGVPGCRCDRRGVAPRDVRGAHDRR